MKTMFKFSALAMVSAVLLSSCGACYKAMQKSPDSITAESNPSTLVLKGQTVTAEVEVNIPAEYFDKDAIMKITPTLVYEGGEVAEKAKMLQGEAVVDNYQAIGKEAGASYKQSVSFDYKPEMDASKLVLKMEVRCEDGKYADFIPFNEIEVAQGVSVISKGFDYSNGGNKYGNFDSGYKKVLTYQESANIMYNISSSVVKKAQITSLQIDELEEFIKKYKDDPRATMGTLQSKGFASPDGPVKFNDKLSQQRSESAKKAVSKEFDELGVEIDAASYGEDWDGFKMLVKESNIKDKELILKVLEMYQSSTKRDEEIKNMAAAFEVLAKEILPQLRRSQMVIATDYKNKTDEELKEIAQSNPSSLKVEEALYVATLLNNKQATMVLEANNSKEASVLNNLAVLYAKEKDFAKAKSLLNQASKKSSSAIISKNLGVVALMEGDVATAEKYIANSDDSDLKTNLAFAKGDYSKAASMPNGNNKVIAYLQNGDVAGAEKSFGKCECAQADYLKAVVAARKGDNSDAVAKLKTAISKDSSLKEKVKKDVEFAKIDLSSL